MVLGDASQQLGPSLLILGCFFFLGVGLGLDMKWAWLAKSFGPTCTFLNFFLLFYRSNSKLHLIVMKFDMYVKKYEEHAI